MMTAWLAALGLGGIVLFRYLVVTLNMRAVAHEKYGMTAITDAFILGLEFWIIKLIAKTEAATLLDQAHYIAGGVVGSMIGIWLTRHWSTTPKTTPKPIPFAPDPDCSACHGTGIYREPDVALGYMDINCPTCTR